MPEALAASERLRTFPTASRRLASTTLAKTLGSTWAETSSILGDSIPIFSFPSVKNICRYTANKFIKFHGR